MWAIGVAASVIAFWLVLSAALMWARPPGMSTADALRVFPDTIRLVRNLATDKTLARGVRLRVGVLLAYLALPFDLIPDFIPVIGQLDDVIVALLILRSIVRAAGPEPIRAHWPGSKDGLALLWKLGALPSAPTP